MYITGEMIPFQERKKIRKVLYSKFTLAVLSGLLFVVIGGAWQIYQKAMVARAERDITARGFADLQSRTKELETSISRLKSNKGIEEEIRQKYTVARDGEEIVIVVDENVKKSENRKVVTDESSWQRLASFLGF